MYPFGEVYLVKIYPKSSLSLSLPRYFSLLFFTSYNYGKIQVLYFHGLKKLCCKLYLFPYFFFFLHDEFHLPQEYYYERRMRKKVSRMIKSVRENW